MDYVTYYVSAELIMVIEMWCFTVNGVKSPKPVYKKQVWNRLDLCKTFLDKVIPNTILYYYFAVKILQVAFAQMQWWSVWL